MKRILLAAILFVLGALHAHAAEPNETFETATIVAGGVFSVADSLSVTTPGDMPDTILANYDVIGGLDQVSDDDGPYETIGGSELLDIPTNSGQIQFAVTGWDDFGFGGGHFQEGYYQVTVEAFDLFGDQVETLSDVFLMEPGDVHEFDMYDDAYVGGTYNVWTGPAEEFGDIDFFKWAGLPSGSTFTVQTIDTGGENIDTYLGLFDSTGELIEAHDDIDLDNNILQSMITGVVPANGELIFAVTGYGDDLFGGEHDITGIYSLQLDVESTTLDGDYNADGNVDAADYVVFRKGLPSGTYATWKTHFGESNNGAGGTAVPEPSAIVLVGLLGILILGVSSRNSGILLACLPAAKNLRM